MRHLVRQLGPIAAVLVTLTLALAACGGESDSAVPEVTRADTRTDAEAEPGTPGGSAAEGALPAPGRGRLDLGARVYELEVTECATDDFGTFNATGITSDGGEFEMTQAYVGGKWFQSQVELDSGSTQIYVIVSAAAEGAEPATVTGKSVSWKQMFRELDKASDSIVFSGEGTVSLTCP